MNIAIIPARGGSKRIPRKNIKLFYGKPIIEYSICAALESGVFDEVMVSTDDVEIADVARSAGARVPFFRSESTSNDTATITDVLLEVIDEYQKINRYFENICAVYPTAPFVTSQTLRAAMQTLMQSDADALIPVVPYSHPPQRGLEIKGNRVDYIRPENRFVRSQDLAPVYHDSGQFCCVKTVAILAQESLFCKETIPLILNEFEAQDIDSETDWWLAELKYKFLFG